MKKIFYQIENGKVIGWTPGTDIFGDPSSTKARMEVWQAENPGVRQVVILDPEQETFKPIPAERLKFEGGKIVEKTILEIEADNQAVQTTRSTKETQVRQFVAGIRDKMMAGTPLTKEEAEFLLGQKKDLFTR